MKSILNFLLIVLITINTTQILAQQIIIEPEQNQPMHFGESVFINSEYYLVGAPFHNSQTGKVYLYSVNGNILLHEFIPPTNAPQFFGSSCAVDDDIIVIGAYGHNVQVGTCYVYYKNEGGDNNWGLVTQLFPNDTAGQAHFGISVDIQGEEILVGAWGEDAQTGAAYLYCKTQGGENNWGEIKHFVPDNNGSNYFGYDVKMSFIGSQNVIAIGAWGEQSETGAVYLYHQNLGGENNWGLQEKLTPIVNSNAYFGRALDIKYGQLIIGAWGEITQSGKAYLFQIQEDESWSLSKTFEPDNNAPQYFGYDVSIFGGTLIIGAWGDNAQSGSLYTYNKNTGGNNNWGLLEKIPAPSNSSNYFGSALSSYGRNHLVGAWGEQVQRGSAYLLNNCDDITPPIFDQAGNDVYINCEEVDNSLTINATDNITEDLFIFVQVTSPSNGDACESSLSKTFTAIDDCGNIAEVSINFHVVDTTAPYLNVAADVTIDCSEDIPGSYADISDNCGEAYCSVSETTETLGDGTYIISRWYTAYDECNNSTSAVQVINVIDETTPSITCPPNETVFCDDPYGPDITGFANAADNCTSSNELLINYTDSSIPVDCPTEINRIWSATDLNENSVTCVQQIFFISDVNNISVTLVPDDETYTCIAEVPAPVGPEATTGCVGEISIEYSEIIDGICPTIITRNWILTDECNNVEEVNQVITIIDDNPPNVTFVPEDIIISCNEVIPDTINPIVFGNCFEEIQIEFSEILSGECPLYINRNWIISDNCNDTININQLITIIDETPPVITNFPSDINISCDNEIPSIENPDVNDNCSENVQVAFSEIIEGDCPTTITRSWIFTDDCGNVSSGNQIISISNPDNINVSDNSNFNFRIISNSNKEYRIILNTLQNEKFQITLYNAIGQKVIRNVIDSKNGENVIPLETQKLKDGLYIIHIIGSSQSLSTSFYKF